jgi:hypothetical protein
MINNAVFKNYGDQGLFRFPIVPKERSPFGPELGIFRRTGAEEEDVTVRAGAFLVDCLCPVLPWRYVQRRPRIDIVAPQYRFQLGSQSGIVVGKRNVDAHGDLFLVSHFRDTTCRKLH